MRVHSGSDEDTVRVLRSMLRCSSQWTQGRRGSHGFFGGEGGARAVFFRQTQREKIFSGREHFNLLSAKSTRPLPLWVGVCVQKIVKFRVSETPFHALWGKILPNSDG